MTAWHLIGEIMTIYRQYPHFKTEVLVASVRHTGHVVRGRQARRPCRHPAAQRAARQLFKHVLTDIGLKAFLDDWAEDRPVDPLTRSGSYGQRRHGHGTRRFGPAGQGDHRRRRRRLPRRPIPTSSSKHAELAERAGAGRRACRGRASSTCSRRS